MNDIKWFDDDVLEELKISCPEKVKEIEYYLHGNCDEWVLDHFQDGDIAVIWNEFDLGIGKIALIHCYIQRQGVFLDVRGETADENLITDGFDYGFLHEKIYCSSLEEYKSWIRNICGYEDKKWAKNSMQKNANKPSLSSQIQSATARASESHSNDSSIHKVSLDDIVQDASKSVSSIKTKIQASEMER